MNHLDLSGFVGTENWYQHPLNRNWAITDGVKYFADNAGNGAYWLLDILVTEPEILKQARDFAAITLSVKASKADLVVTDGNEKEVFRRHIEYTDCPEGDWKFFMYHGVILLTSEY